MLKKCIVCGQIFHAKRSSAKYCSNTCRVRAYRSGVPQPPEHPPIIAQRTEDEVEDLALLIGEARQLSGAFIAQSKSAPLPLRAKCSRVGNGIRAALEREEW